MAKVKREKTGLKMLAADAKARMKNGFHNKNEFDNKFTSTDYLVLVKRSMKGKQTNQEEQFYRKVKEILSEGTVTNPIMRLVDKKELVDLSYSARQRYLLEISQKYNKVKSEIETLHY